MRAAGYKSLAHVSRLVNHDPVFQAEVERARGDLGIPPPQEPARALSTYPVEVLPAYLEADPDRNLLQPVGEEFARLSPGERALVIAAKLDVGAAHAADFLGAVIRDEEKDDGLRLSAAKVLVRARTAGPAIAVNVTNVSNETNVDVQALLVDPASAQLASDLLAKLGKTMAT
jgi:hypothetical protein